MSKRFIPFGLLPGHWGLKGQTRDRARIDYELNGYEKDLAHAELALSDDVLRAKVLELQLQYNIIEQREHDFAIADLRGDDETKLKVQLKYHKITETEFAKQLATLKNEPWVHFPEVLLDKENPGLGSVSLDWNKPFIDMLEENGYVSPKEEETVDLWLTDLCKNIALEELSGTGVFAEEAEEAMDLKRKRLDNDRIEVS